MGVLMSVGAGLMGMLMAVVAVGTTLVTMLVLMLVLVVAAHNASLLSLLFEIIISIGPYPVKLFSTGSVSRQVKKKSRKRPFPEGSMEKGVRGRLNQQKCGPQLLGTLVVTMMPVIVDVFMSMFRRLVAVLMGVVAVGYFLMDVLMLVFVLILVFHRLFLRFVRLFGSHRYSH